MLNEEITVSFETLKQVDELYLFIEKYGIDAQYVNGTIKGYLSGRKFPALEIKMNILSSREYYMSINGTFDNYNTLARSITFDEFFSKLKKLVIKDSRMKLII